VEAKEETDTQKTTLAELLDPVWHRDFDWDMEVLDVLKKAVRGLELVLGEEDVDAEYLNEYSYATNGTQLVDALVGLAEKMSA
jgi:hypothetical protein